jgi:hypothetical protein
MTFANCSFCYLIFFCYRLAGHSASATAWNHGLFHFKDNNTKYRHLKKLTCKETLWQVFLRVYRLEIQSVMLVFRPSFVNYCPTNHLSGSPPPPLPCVKIQYLQTICGWEGARGGGVVELCWRSHLQNLTLCIWPDSEPGTLLDHPIQNLGGEGASDR